MVFRQGGVAVPKIQLVAVEPARFELVIAMAEGGIAAGHRRDQRLDHFILDLISQIAGRDRPRVAAPFVLNLLVLGQGVGDMSEQRGVIAEHAGEGQRRLAPGVGRWRA